MRARAQAGELLRVIDERGTLTVEEAENRLGTKVTPSLLDAVRHEAVVFQRKRVVAESPARRRHVLLASSGMRADALVSDALLVSLLRQARTDKTHLHSRAQLRDLFTGDKRSAEAGAFDASLERRLRTGTWPRAVAAVEGRGTTWLMLTEDLHTAPAADPRPPPSSPTVSSQRTEGSRQRSFADEFEAAFRTIDRELGGVNQVPLRDLRERLDGWDRETFDRELRTLRQADRYVLQTHEGRHGSFDPSLAAAGLDEGGRRFVYVARRIDG